MILKLAYYGDPILRQKAASVAEITEELRILVANMVDTMHAARNGVGLAAPQVFQSLAVFIIQFPNPDSKDKWVPGRIEVFINPKILSVSDEMWLYSEGCLSIPKLYEEVPRPIKLKIQAQDLEGNTFIRDYEGYEARMVLHENDHINGVLFIDRIDKERRKIIEPDLRAIKKKYTSK